jgi:DNA-binding NarL/FixJ family response regulator
VDVLLPGDDGFDLVRTAAARWPALPMILVSGRDQLAMRTRARASGARGFISKTTPAVEFIARMEAVLAGGTTFDALVEAGDVPVLTTRQAEILDLLAQGHGNKEVRYRLGIAERTVRAHLTELFQLLGVHGRMPAVIRARELGLIE